MLLSLHETSPILLFLEINESIDFYLCTKLAQSCVLLLEINELIDFYLCNLVFYSSKWMNRSIETVFGIVLKENFLKYIFVDKKLGALIPVFPLPATLTSSARRAFDAPVPFASLGAQLSRISPPLTMSPPLRSHPLTNRSPSSRRRLPPGDSYPSTSRQNCNQRSESISLFSRDVRISFFYLNSQAIKFFFH